MTGRSEPATRLVRAIDLPLAPPKPGRRFAPRIAAVTPSGSGEVHLNVLAPGARAGGHYHRISREFFINTGPGELMLTVVDPADGRTERIAMVAAGLGAVVAYEISPGLAHAVQNPTATTVVLAIVVETDLPDDVVAYPVPD